MHLPFLCSTEAARFSNPEAGGQAAINSQREALFKHKRGRGDPFEPLSWTPAGKVSLFPWARSDLLWPARVRGENQAECKYLTPSERCQ